MKGVGSCVEFKCGGPRMFRRHSFLRGTTATSGARKKNKFLCVASFFGSELAESILSTVVSPSTARFRT